MTEIEKLKQELDDERYRHDRLQDYCVALGEELRQEKAENDRLRKMADALREMIR